MKTNRLFLILGVFGFLFFNLNPIVIAADPNLKDYNVVVVENLEIQTGSPAPESAGLLMAEKAVYQIQRYSEKYKLFDMVVKEGSKSSKEISSDKRILMIRGEVKEYTKESTGRRIGRSFIPGGGYTGTAVFAAHYQLIDKESGNVLYETDLRSLSTGTNDTVEYAMERNGEALAKVLTKFKGK
jgi:hypothetical protein